MKKKLNVVKQFVHNNKGIIENGLFIIGDVFVKISNARAANAYQIGVNGCWDQLIVDNSDNPEFVKMLSDFAVKHPVYMDRK